MALGRHRMGGIRLAVKAASLFDSKLKSHDLAPRFRSNGHDEVPKHHPASEVRIL